MFPQGPPFDAAATDPQDAVRLLLSTLAGTSQMTQQQLQLVTQLQLQHQLQQQQHQQQQQPLLQQQLQMSTQALLQQTLQQTPTRTLTPIVRDPTPKLTEEQKQAVAQEMNMRVLQQKENEALVAQTQESQRAAAAAKATVSTHPILLTASIAPSTSGSEQPRRPSLMSNLDQQSRNSSSILHPDSLHIDTSESTSVSAIEGSPVPTVSPDADEIEEISETDVQTEPLPEKRFFSERLEQIENDKKAAQATISQLEKRAESLKTIQERKESSAAAVTSCRRASDEGSREPSVAPDVDEVPVDIEILDDEEDEEEKLLALPVEERIFRRTGVASRIENAETAQRFEDRPSTSGAKWLNCHTPMEIDEGPSTSPQRASPSPSRAPSVMELAPPPGAPPSYVEPCEAPGMADLFKQFESFRPNLIAKLRQRKEERDKVIEHGSKVYEELYEKWAESVREWENSAKKRKRDLQRRDLYENVFPELKANRESLERGERGERLARRSGLINFADVPEGERGDDDSKMRMTAITVPSWYDKQDSSWFQNNSNIVVNESVEYRRRIDEFKNSWTEEERLIFQTKIAQWGKNFAAIKCFLERRTVGDCVLFYYLTKDKMNYKISFKKIKRKITKVYKPPIMPREEELSKLQPLMADANISGLSVAVESKCCMCNMKINEVNGGAARVVTRSSYATYGIDVRNADVKVCARCEAEVNKNRNSTRCLTHACESTKHKRGKQIRAMPNKWKGAEERFKRFLAHHFGFPREMSKCCSHCFKQLNRKLDKALNGELNREIEQWEAAAATRWPKAELDALDRLVDEHGFDWENVCSALCGRTAEQCKFQWEQRNGGSDSITATPRSLVIDEEDEETKNPDEETEDSEERRRATAPEPEPMEQENGELLEETMDEPESAADHAEDAMDLGEEAAEEDEDMPPAPVNAPTIETLSEDRASVELSDVPPPIAINPTIRQVKTPSPAVATPPPESPVPAAVATVRTSSSDSSDDIVILDEKVSKPGPSGLLAVAGRSLDVSVERPASTPHQHSAAAGKGSITQGTPLLRPPSVQIDHPSSSSAQGTPFVLQATSVPPLIFPATTAAATNDLIVQYALQQQQLHQQQQHAAQLQQQAAAQHQLTLSQLMQLPTEEIFNLLFGRGVALQGVNVEQMSKDLTKELTMYAENITAVKAVDEGLRQRMLSGAPITSEVEQAQKVLRVESEKLEVQRRRFQIIQTFLMQRTAAASVPSTTTATASLIQQLQQQLSAQQQQPAAAHILQAQGSFQHAQLSQSQAHAIFTKKQQEFEEAKVSLTQHTTLLEQTQAKYQNVERQFLDFKRQMDTYQRLNIMSSYESARAHVVTLEPHLREVNAELEQAKQRLLHSQNYFRQAHAALELAQREVANSAGVVQRAQEAYQLLLHQQQQQQVQAVVTQAQQQLQQRVAAAQQQLGAAASAVTSASAQTPSTTASVAPNRTLIDDFRTAQLYNMLPGTSAASASAFSVVSGGSALAGMGSDEGKEGEDLRKAEADVLNANHYLNKAQEEEKRAKLKLEGISQELTKAWNRRSQNEELTILQSRMRQAQQDEHEKKTVVAEAEKIKKAAVARRDQLKAALAASASAQASERETRERLADAHYAQVLKKKPTPTPTPTSAASSSSQAANLLLAAHSQPQQQPQTAHVALGPTKSLTAHIGINRSSAAGGSLSSGRSAAASSAEDVGKVLMDRIIHEELAAGGTQSHSNAADSRVMRKSGLGTCLLPQVDTHKQLPSHIHRRTQSPQSGSRPSSAHQPVMQHSPSAGPSTPSQSSTPGTLNTATLSSTVQPTMQSLVTSTSAEAATRVSSLPLNIPTGPISTSSSYFEPLSPESDAPTPPVVRPPPPASTGLNRGRFSVLDWDDMPTGNYCEQRQNTPAPSVVVPPPRPAALLAAMIPTTPSAASSTPGESNYEPLSDDEA